MNKNKNILFRLTSIILVLYLLPMVFFSQIYELFAQEVNINNEMNSTSIVYDTTKQQYKPRISWLYGFNKNNHKSIMGSFTTTGMSELRLGRELLMFDSLAPQILRYYFTYTSLCNNLNQIGESPSTGKIHTDLWRVGFGTETGYGYEINKSSVVMYNDVGMQLVWLKPIDYVVNQSDSTILAPFNRRTMAGTNTKSGIEIRFVPYVTADLGFERAAIYSGESFWKLLGSLIIELGGHILIDESINLLKETSPRSVPIINIIVKSGFSFGLYELRRSQMYWPFESNPPFMIDSFKIGLVLTY